MMGGGIMHGGPRRNQVVLPNKKVNSKIILKKMIKYLKTFIIAIIISISLAIVGQVFNILGPERIGSITNQLQSVISNPSNYSSVTLHPITMQVIDMLGFSFPMEIANEIIKSCIILIGIYIICLIAQMGQGIIMTSVTVKMTKKMRSDVYAKISRLPLSYFDSRQIGDIMSIITNDVDQFSQGMINSINTIVTSITAILGIGVMMFIVAWQLALINLVMIPIALVLMMLTMRISQKHFKANARLTGQVTGIIEENYTGHDVVKAFNASFKQSQEFEKTNQELKKAGHKAQFLSGILFPLMNFVSNISYLLVAVIGGNLASRGTIGIGDITSMIMYSRRFSQPIVQIGQALNQVQTALAAADRIFTFLEAKEMKTEHTLAPLNRPLKGKVEFKNVKFGYLLDKTIIHNFSLKVETGQRIAIVGPTGAGKTTLVNLLMKFYDIDSGDIVLDDISINEIKKDDLRENFAMVLQDTWLFSGSIKENLVYNQKDISHEQLVSICELCNVHHFIESLPNGYNTIIEDDSQVSSGQRQLLTIARAMVKNSQILILDEATSNVDTRTEVLIQEAMNELMKGKTSFIIAHRLSTIRNADKILVLNNGDIVEIGNHQDLLQKNGFYAKLYYSQYENN